MSETEVRFGECAGCFNQLERPFWDTYCFECQDGLDDEDDLRDDEEDVA